MINEGRSGYRVEPLGTGHDRASFHSGVPELDRYLHEQAGQDARRKVAAPFVLIDPSGASVGYYTLSAYRYGSGSFRNPQRSLPATRFSRQHCWAGWQSALRAAANTLEHSF